jgi:hypothetical protein
MTRVRCEHFIIIIRSVFRLRIARDSQCMVSKRKKKRRSEPPESDVDAVAPDGAPASGLSKSQKRKLQKKRAKQTVAAAQAAAAEEKRAAKAERAACATAGASVPHPPPRPLTFWADEEDHCETAPQAYEHVLALLKLIAEDLGRSPEELQIYGSSHMHACPPATPANPLYAIAAIAVLAAAFYTRDARDACHARDASDTSDASNRCAPLPLRLCLHPHRLRHHRHLQTTHADLRCRPVLLQRRGRAAPRGTRLRARSQP